MMRWTMGYSGWKGKRVPRQAESERRGDGTTIPEPIARLAYEEYAHQFGTQQSFERIHERGGFGTIEMILLLADLIERQRDAR